jgi:hypothetical protein
MSTNRFFLLAAAVLSTACLAQSPPAAPTKEFAFGPATAKTVDPNQVLGSLESDLKELMAQNDKKRFGLSPGQSEKARAMLSAMYQSITRLHAKYRRVKEPVDAAPLYKEIEDTLDKSGSDDRLLILALKGKGNSPQSRRCDGFCWKECGPNHVGDWGCFLTCQRHCS